MSHKTTFPNGIAIKEITTPTALADYGKIYTKTDNSLYFQDGAGVEHKLSIIGQASAEMYFNENAVATVIETADTPVMLRNLTAGKLNNFTYTAGSTGAITGYADGSGVVEVAAAGHGLSTGDIISIRGTTNYNGIWEITYIDDNNLAIPATWVADDGASDWDEGDYVTAGASTDGEYTLDFALSGAESGAAGSNIKIQTVVNDSLCTKCINERKFSTNDRGNLVGTAEVDVVAGDRVAFVIVSDGTNDFTFKYGNFNMHRI